MRFGASTLDVWRRRISSLRIAGVVVILLNQMTRCVDSRMRLSRIQVVVKMENLAYFVVVKM